MYLFKKENTMNDYLTAICTKMLKEDCLSFIILEEKILLNGLF